MPEDPNPKEHPHPFKRAAEQQSSRAADGSAHPSTPARYAELAVTSNFTFLTGASHPEELAEQASILGHTAASIADTNTLAGIVRAHVAAKEAGVPIAIGCRLRLTSPAGLEIVVYPTTRAAYSRLCTLLTTGKRRAPKGECDLNLHDLIEHSQDLLAIVIPPPALDDDFIETLRGLRTVFDDDRLSLAISRAYEPADTDRLHQVATLGAHLAVPIVAVNDVHYHHPARRALQDVLTCIRHGCTIETAGMRLKPNAESHLKSPEEMAHLFAEYPEAIARSTAIAERATNFSLDELRYEYPAEPCPPGQSAIEYLRDLTWRGAATRYTGDIPAKVCAMLESELTLIEELAYEPYFLTCYDIVSFARAKGILCQGRGGAANSAVCYCLGITEVDPARFDLLFARFVSRERREPPDIDIDFEHERREEVIQYIYEKYGRDRAALTAEVISYRTRSAVREVGKALGLSLDCVDALAKNLDRWGDKANDDRLREAGLGPTSDVARHLRALTTQLVGFPRHLSQHVGGFVITRGPLHELVPIENAAMEDRTVIEWDKDDIDAMGMLKVDCLGLGMLTAIRKAFDMLARATDTELSIAKVMTDHAEDPEVYAMIQRADTLGVFQIESRAQMTMLPRLRPQTFYDLVIEVAIVRPGPIQGDMVHPYLRRRTGEEEVSFPSEEVRNVLERTLGVPLFQEQAMQLAIVAAGFTPDEADGLRRAMAAWKRKGNLMERYGQRLISGMLANGYEEDFAQRCFSQLKGFSEYGFPESHAASFAILVYVSCWLKRHHPAAFAGAVINSQPMGFYAPAQLVRDAKEHGVEVRAIEVNRSAWECELEEKRRRDGETERRRREDESWETWGRDGPALRLGMKLVKGLKEEDAELVVGAVRKRGGFSSIERLWKVSGIGVGALRRLAKADAFRSMGLDRRAALWAIKPLRDDRLPLFEEADQELDEPPTALPAIKPGRHVLMDYESTGLSLKAHPLSFVRKRLAPAGVIECRDLRSEDTCPTGREVTVAGVVLVRQRPGTASGVVFITLEDETGIANLVVWPKVFERFRRAARLSRVLIARGKVERQGEVVHVHASHMDDLDQLIPSLARSSRDFH